MKNLDINNLARTVIIGGVLLPVTLSMTGLLNVSAKSIRAATVKAAEVSNAEQVRSDMGDKVFEPCLDFYFSKADSKLEREAKNDIDDAFGGDVDHSGVCRYFFS